MGICGDFQAIHVSLLEVYIIFLSPREDPPYHRARFAPAEPHHRPFIATPLRRRRLRGEEQTRRHRGVRSTFRGRVQGPGRRQGLCRTRCRGRCCRTSWWPEPLPGSLWSWNFWSWQNGVSGFKTIWNGKKGIEVSKPKGCVQIWWSILTHGQLDLDPCQILQDHKPAKSLGPWGPWTSNLNFHLQNLMDSPINPTDAWI